jgi:hypothetical protein
MTDSKDKERKFNAIITAQSVGKNRMGIDAIVGSNKVQQAKSQIPKSKGSQ